MCMRFFVITFLRMTELQLLSYFPQHCKNLIFIFLCALAGAKFVLCIHRPSYPCQHCQLVLGQALCGALCFKIFAWGWFYFHRLHFYCLRFYRLGKAVFSLFFVGANRCGTEKMLPVYMPYFVVYGFLPLYAVQGRVHINVVIVVVVCQRVCPDAGGQAHISNNNIPHCPCLL